MSKRFLDAQALMAGACANSGLSDYLDEGLRERFAYVIDLFNGFAAIPEDKYAAAAQQVQDTLVKRLQVARDWARHPEILDQKIVQPFFVLGSARAGTTFTQMILDLDEGHRTPRYHDVQHPSPPPGSDRAADAAALAEQGEYVEFILENSPSLLPAHPYFDQRGATEAEDEYVYSLDFDLVYPLWYLKVPSLPQTIPPRDPARAFRFYRHMLCQLQFKRPTRRWVGKGILHQYMPGPLMQEFPDMVGFWLHRPPEEYIASLLQLLEHQYAPFNGDLYDVTPEAMVAQLKMGVDAILADPAIDDPRLHHIRFRDFVSNPADCIAAIYDAHEIPFTDGFADAIRSRTTDPAYRADRFGKFSYSLEKFGLDKDALRRTFADYCDRFDI